MTASNEPAEQRILKACITHCGGPSAVARALNVRRQAISQWVRYGIPPTRVIEFCKLVASMDGSVQPYSLRPDVFPVPAQPRRTK